MQYINYMNYVNSYIYSAAPLDITDIGLLLIVTFCAIIANNRHKKNSAKNIKTQI